MKGDMNLLPKKEAGMSLHVLFFRSIISLVVLSVVGYYFVFLPNEEFFMVSKEIKDKQSEMASFAGIGEEYERLSNEITELKRRTLVIEELSNKNVKLTEKIDQIGNGMPVDISLEKISYENEVMKAVGISPDMELIAQFMVNLRKMDRVIGVELSSVGYDEENLVSDANNEEDLNIDTIEQYKFELSIYYTLQPIGEQELNLEDVINNIQEQLDEEGEEE